MTATDGRIACILDSWDLNPAKTTLPQIRALARFLRLQGCAAVALEDFQETLGLPRFVQLLAMDGFKDVPEGRFEIKQAKTLERHLAKLEVLQ